MFAGSRHDGWRQGERDGEDQGEMIILQSLPDVIAKTVKCHVGNDDVRGHGGIVTCTSSIVALA